MKEGSIMEDLCRLVVDEPQQRPASTAGYSTANRLLFADKEYSDYGGESHHDFGARHLASSAIPRFTTMDPLCEKRPDESPYIFAAANPVMFTDPTGCIVEGDTTGLFKDYQVKLQSDYDFLKGNSEAIEYRRFLKTQLNHISRLKESSQLYIINHDRNADAGSITYDSNKDAVIVNFVIKDNNNKYENYQVRMQFTMSSPYIFGNLVKSTCLK